MKSPRIKQTFDSRFGIWLIACIAMMLANATGVVADDDWQLPSGLESLRPLNGVEPFVAFLSPQQTKVQPTQPGQPSLAPPKPPLMESYDDWLDASEYKRVPRVRGGHFALPSLLAPSIATDTIGNGRTPKGFRADDPAPAHLLPETSEYRGTHSWTLAYWAAANTYSNPRYFEDRMLERHGHERCPKLTPVISGARFFTSIAMLPYLMTVSPPCEHESTLGYYRSGSPAPALRQRPPYDRRAVLVEVASIAGFVLAFP